MKQFEYKHIVSGKRLLDDSLNEYGKEGWELLKMERETFNEFVYIFKRELK